MTGDQNDLLSFIAKDVVAGRKANRLRWIAPAISLCFPALFNLTMGFNGRLSWSESWIPWVMLLLFLGLLFLFSKFVGRTSRLSRFSLIGSFVVTSAFLFPQLGSAFSPLYGHANFWADTVRCFVSGFIIGVLTAVSLMILTFRWGPVPTASTRAALSQVAGLAGAVGLFYHCPNSDLVHLFAGHGFQIVLVFALTYLFSRYLFAKIVKKQLGHSADQFTNIAEFDRK